MATPLSRLYRTAFVTGASAGIGKAFVEMLLAEGISVWGTARDSSRLNSFNSSAATFTPVAFDLAIPEAMEKAFNEAAQQAGGGFDIVINNAGYGVYGWFPNVEFGLWRSQIDAMLTNTAWLCHLALKPMLARRRGCLVNVSSLAAQFPLPFMSGYNVVKAGLSALSESLIFETHGTSVNVIDFRPGDYCTNFNNAMPPPSASAAPTAQDERCIRAWRVLDKNLRTAPPPNRAANDLRRALLRQRSGIVRSGEVFQAVIGPLISRCIPTSGLRLILRHYFGVA